MGRFLSESDLAGRILHHIAEGTTDRSETVWREPVGHYLSADRLARETALLRRTWVPYCPSAALAEAGAFIAREAAGVSLVAARGRDGEVKVFRNACRHRGMRVAEGAGCAMAFVCRYHGWAYSLDGALRTVPHEDGFPGLDKSAHGLVPVAAAERDGLVWVCQEPASGDTGPQGVAGLVGDGQMLFAASEYTVAANWKIFLESFIEGYHIKSTHPETFLPYGYDNLNVVEYEGPHARVTYPFQRILKLKGVAPAQRRIGGGATLVTHVFPNVIVTGLSRHTVVVVLEPVSLGETRVHSYSLAPRPADPKAAEAALAEARRDAAFVGTTGAAEDRAVVEAIQKGLTSGANTHLTFGAFEGAPAHFHRELTKRLNEAV